MDIVLHILRLTVYRMERHHHMKSEIQNLKNVPRDEGENQKVTKPRANGSVVRQ
jgi:hypothetical protein